MTIEQSHGKARTTLPRSSDFGGVPAAGDRTVGRAADGKFGSGNQAGRHKGWKQAIRRLAGVSDKAAITVLSDTAWRLFCASMRDMPSDGPNVRSLVAMKSRHETMAGYWGDKANELGLDTDAGKEADDRAMKHGVRAERLTVTALDVAIKLANSRKSTGDETPFWIVKDGAK